MIHKITIEASDDELEMLASLFNTVTICEMNADGTPLERDIHPPINRFCHWSKFCTYLCEKFRLGNNLHKYPGDIARALAVRSIHRIEFLTELHPR
jgi:hypothetical protein